MTRTLSLEKFGTTPFQERLVCCMWEQLEAAKEATDPKGNRQKELGQRPSRWQRSKTWRSPSSTQMHQKYIYMWNNSYRTPIECWQKTSDFPKGKKIPTYLGRAKEKRKKQRQKNRDGNCTSGKEL